MSQTTSTVVSAEIMSEILANPLEGLDSKIVLSNKLNLSSIDGFGTSVRKIPKRQILAVAVDDVEGVATGPAASMGYDSTISLTPTAKRQNVLVTIKALRRVMPGMTRAEVMSAVSGGAAVAVPFLRDAAAKLLSSHLRRLETDAFLLFSGLSNSAGTTNTALSFTTCLSALFTQLSLNPEHENLAFVFDEKGAGDLRSVLGAGTGAALSTLWGNNGTDTSLFRHMPDAAKSGLRGSIFDIPVFAGDSALMTTANSAVDRVGGLIVVGRGAVGEAGSMRGFAEVCEGHSIDFGFAYNLNSDDVDAVARYEWDVGEHTDQHGVKIIYKKD